MSKLDTMIEAHGWQRAEFAAWGWAAELDAELCAVVEAQLAVHGINGIGDLLLVGAALGGVDDAQRGELVEFAEEYLAPDAVAA